MLKIRYSNNITIARVVRKITKILEEGEQNMNYTVNKDTLIGEILTADPKTAPFFLDMGMHCLGCPSSTGESLEQACIVHGVPTQELISTLNKHFESYVIK